MTNKITAVSQSLATDELVELYQVDLSKLGGGVLYLSPQTNGTTAIAFDGNTYTPIAIEASGFEITGNSSLPTPTMKVQSTASLQAAMNTYNDFIGGKVTRIRTFKQFLDGESNADPTQHFPIDVFYIERKTLSNKNEIEWELSAILDQMGVKLPRRKILKDICTARYRYYNGTAFVYTSVKDGGCPYNGSSYFDVEGNTVTDPADDKCGKRMSECERRYGTNGKLPFFGFPGVRDK